MPRVAHTARRLMRACGRAPGALARGLDLSTRGVWLLLMAVATAAASAFVAIGVGEDVTRHNGAASYDPQRLQLFVDHRPAWLIAAARGVTAIGTAPVLAVVALVAAGLLWWRGQRLLVALAPGIALGGTGVSVVLVKQLVGRVRPDLAVRLVADNEASFPSGHSADSAALFVTLAVIVAALVLRKPLARAAAIAAAFLASGVIGLSRLVLAAHWPTDVVGGWAVGLLVAVAIGTVAVLASRMTPPNLQQPQRRRAQVVNLLLAERERAAARPFAM